MAGPPTTLRAHRLRYDHRGWRTCPHCGVGQVPPELEGLDDKAKLPKGVKLDDK